MAATAVGYIELQSKPEHTINVSWKYNKAQNCGLWMKAARESIEHSEVVEAAEGSTR